MPEAARPPFFTPLITPRLRLDLMPAEAVPDWFAWRSLPQIARRQRWVPGDNLEMLWFIQRFAGGPEIRPGEWKQLGVFLRRGGGLVGDCGFRTEPGGEAEIGYNIAPAAQRRGFASEAVSAMVNFLFLRLAVTRVTARTVPDNIASMGLLLKLGFARVPGPPTVLEAGGCAVHHVTFHLERG